MTSGRLTEKNGKFYIVLSFKNSEGKHKEKWIATGLNVKGNKRKADEILANYKENYNTETGELSISAKVEISETNNGLIFTKPIPLIKTSQQNNLLMSQPFNLDSDQLFGDYMLEWVEGQKSKIELSSYSGYKINIDTKIVPYFNKRGITLKGITPDDIDKFYKCKLKSVSANTVIHYHANIRKALQSAYFKGLISNNPADRVERPKVDKFIGSYYNKEDMMKLLKNVEGKKIEFPVFMACYYGLRRSEIVGLKWDAIDLDYKIFTIRHTVVACQLDGKHTVIAKNRAKTKKSLRTLPIIPEFEKHLYRIKKEQEKNKTLFGNSYNHEYDDYICVDINGERFKPDFISQNFSLLLKNNNMRHIRFHDLRHSCATLLRHEGVPMEDIQKWLGHSTITTTENIYAHFEDKQHIVSANKIANALMNTAESSQTQSCEIINNSNYNDRVEDGFIFNDCEDGFDDYPKVGKKSDMEM